MERLRCYRPGGVEHSTPIHLRSELGHRISRTDPLLLFSLNAIREMVLCGTVTALHGEEGVLLAEDPTELVLALADAGIDVSRPVGSIPCFRLS